jgi:hypothetical protein
VVGKNGKSNPAALRLRGAVVGGRGRLKKCGAPVG